MFAAQTVKCLSTMWETWVRSLGREDFLEKEMATHSSTLAWRSPWREEPGAGYSVHGVAKSQTRLSDFTSLHRCLQLSRQEGCSGATVSSGYRPGMQLNTRECTRKPPTTKNHLAPDVRSAKVEKPMLENLHKYLINVYIKSNTENTNRK